MKNWWDRPPKERCYAYPLDMKNLMAGMCLRKVGHPGAHSNGYRIWMEGDVTSQPLAPAPDPGRAGDRR